MDIEQLYTINSVHKKMIKITLQAIIMTVIIGRFLNADDIRGTFLFAFLDNDAENLAKSAYDGIMYMEGRIKHMCDFCLNRSEFEC